MFIDEAQISVSSGGGGHGMVSFRREKYVPHGGPDGGDGGRGGDVLLRVNRSLNTLASITPGRHYRAEAGRPGGIRLRAGRGGESIVIEVPPGTLVRDAERGHVLRDLRGAEDEFVVVQGGLGGKGNKHFAHATNQTPRQSTEGRPGQTRRLRLELRLVADVGLVGLPNAGKSTFLRRVSKARPRVADYPFTTLKPVLGIVLFGLEDGFAMADIPGLIEGAHAGAGLGDRFLRHVARTRLLLHLVDASVGPEEAVAAWRTVAEELRQSELRLDRKPAIVALTKLDLCPEPGPVIEALAAAVGGPVAGLCSHTGEGVEELLGRLRSTLAEMGKEAPDEASKEGEPSGGAQLG